jgi:tRNA-dihydrouridine synthase 1
MLTRSFMPPAERASVLAYTPMLHARLYADNEKYRRSHFEPTRAQASRTATASGVQGGAVDGDSPYLDGNPAVDRPLFVQFCANDPDALLEAAQRVAPYCDAVDLNLGCPQGIARKGNYGAFLQEDQELIYRLVHILHTNLSVPVTAKIRILETKEKTLSYARNVLSAGASILTVHGRRREQKGHLTGVADWEYIRYLRHHLPADTVIFANGNVLQRGDLERCLTATGADGVMSAEGNLSNPALFAAEPALGEEVGEYWKVPDGRGGWRVDAVMRRYLDILWQDVLGEQPPARRKLFLPGDDDTAWIHQNSPGVNNDANGGDEQGPSRKKRKKDSDKREKNEVSSPNFTAVQAHLFHLLRHFVTRHTDVRDILARTRAGNMHGYEQLLAMIERKVAEGMLEYERTGGQSVLTEWKELEEQKLRKEQAEAERENRTSKAPPDSAAAEDAPDAESSLKTIRECRRPWWVVQPIVRPLPREAVAKGAVTLKPARKRLSEQASMVHGREGPAVVVEELNGTAGRPQAVMAAKVGSVA